LCTSQLRPIVQHSRNTAVAVCCWHSSDDYFHLVLRDDRLYAIRLYFFMYFNLCLMDLLRLKSWYIIRRENWKFNHPIKKKFLASPLSTRIEVYYYYDVDTVYNLAKQQYYSYNRTTKSSLIEAQKKYYCTTNYGEHRISGTWNVCNYRHVQPFESVQLVIIT
jgi:hypothetical protein